MGKGFKNLFIFIVVVVIAYSTHWFSWINGPMNAAGGWVAKEGRGAVAWIGGWFGHGGKQRLSAAEIVSRTEPAVYRVISGGNVDLMSPKAIVLTPGNSPATEGNLAALYKYVPPLVVQHYETAHAAGLTLGEGRGAYCWNMLLADPGKYLQYSGEGSITVEARRVPFGAATAFAVSPMGILVTNAHVVEDGTPAASFGGASVARQALIHFLEAGPLVASLKQIQHGIGSPCPAADRLPVAQALMKFLYNKSHLYEPFTKIVVMLNYRPDAVPPLPATFPQLSATGVGAASFPSVASIIKNGLSLPRASVAQQLGLPSLHWLSLDSYIYAPGSKFVGYYAKVLTKGAPYPGKDVAILQLDDLKIGKSLICLPLADSTNFALGSRVRCFGFPAVAVQKQLMKLSARYQVTAMEATIDSVEATNFGWSAFHMESFINHGDSGGPEIDQYGRVVAINDAGKTGTGQDWSVPSNLVKTFLKKVGIKPHVSTLSQLWFKGQKLFWKKHYRQAQRIFYKVLKMQCGQNLKPSSKYGAMKVTTAAGKIAIISNGARKPTSQSNPLAMPNPLLNFNPFSTPGWSNAPPLANWYVLAALAECQRKLKKH